MKGRRRRRRRVKRHDRPNEIECWKAAASTDNRTKTECRRVVIVWTTRQILPLSTADDEITSHLFVS